MDSRVRDAASGPLVDVGDEQGGFVDFPLGRLEESGGDVQDTPLEVPDRVLVDDWFAWRGAVPRALQCHQILC